MDDDRDTVDAVEHSIQEVDNSEPPHDNDWPRFANPREVHKIIRNVKAKFSSRMETCNTHTCSQAH